jgi:hypothetical protein
MLLKFTIETIEIFTYNVFLVLLSIANKITYFFLISQKKYPKKIFDNFFIYNLDIWIWVMFYFKQKYVTWKA